MSKSRSLPSLEDLKVKFEESKKNEIDKNALIEKLFKENEKISDRNKKLESRIISHEDLEDVYRKEKNALEGKVRDLEDVHRKEKNTSEEKIRSLEDYRKEKNTLEGKVRGLESQMAHSTFVLALIDGDLMPFEDRLIKKGLEGGQEAARLLKQNIKECLKGRSISESTTAIIRIHADFKGLARIYQKINIITEAVVYEDFVRGFNMFDPFCDYTDAGRGHRCDPNAKLNVSFKLLVNNVHCQQVFFGGCSDIGYARALSSYSRDPVAAKKITFLKGPEWAKEMRAVKDNLDVHSFENTFRKTALPRSNKRTPLTIEPPTPKRTKMTVKKESPASEDLVLVPSRTPSQRRSQGAMQSPPPPDLIEKTLMKLKWM
ncbi:hypothetical protein MMC10_009607 [Thelotrema lepadinum]|nr:hypothetical protein [Thelotrema lepadinum]